MIHKRVINIPQDPSELYKAALDVSYHSWVDEKNTNNNPSFARQNSKLTYGEAYKLIEGFKPHWTI